MKKIISDLFNNLISVINNRIQELKKEAHNFISDDNIQKANLCLSEVKSLKVLIKKTESLKKEYVKKLSKKKRVVIKQKANKKLKKGEKTTLEAYKKPILISLYKRGGKERVKIILADVFEIMKDNLKPIDYKKLNSGEIRWKNTAEWARNELVKEKLLKNDSPHGEWELSEEGIKKAKLLIEYK